jgi:hypothetical protein
LVLISRSSSARPVARGADPNWATPARCSLVAFAGIIYLGVSFAMSRYALYTERRLDLVKAVTAMADNAKPLADGAERATPECARPRTVAMDIMALNKWFGSSMCCATRPEGHAR